MTTFEDGPAKGQCLLLARAPQYLRVVQVQTTHFDALDKLDDEARPEEKIHAYKLNGKPGICHINRRGGSGGWYTVANYILVPNQPTDEEMRDTSRWRDWCRAQSSPPAPVTQMGQTDFQLID
jgi:hypothetical protein